MFTVYFQSVRCQSSVMFTVYFQSVRCQSSVTVRLSTVSCLTHNRSVENKSANIKRKKNYSSFWCKQPSHVHCFPSMFPWIRFTIFGLPLGTISWLLLSPVFLLEINWVNFVNTRSPAYNVFGYSKHLDKPTDSFVSKSLTAKLKKVQLHRTTAYNSFLWIFLPVFNRNSAYIQSLNGWPSECEISPWCEQ